jgi:hypothetical protein
MGVSRVNLAVWRIQQPRYLYRRRQIMPGLLALAKLLLSSSLSYMTVHLITLTTFLLLVGLFWAGLFKIASFTILHGVSQLDSLHNWRRKRQDRFNTRLMTYSCLPFFCQKRHRIVHFSVAVNSWNLWLKGYFLISFDSGKNQWWIKSLIRIWIKSEKQDARMTVAFI